MTDMVAHAIDAAIAFRLSGTDDPCGTHGLLHCAGRGRSARRLCSNKPASDTDHIVVNNWQQLTGGRHG